MWVRPARGVGGYMTSTCTWLVQTAHVCILATTLYSLPYFLLPGHNFYLLGIPTPQPQSNRSEVRSWGEKILSGA